MQGSTSLTGNHLRRIHARIVPACAILLPWLVVVFCSVLRVFACCTRALAFSLLFLFIFCLFPRYLKFFVIVIRVIEFRSQWRTGGLTGNFQQWYFRPFVISFSRDFTLDTIFYSRIWKSLFSLLRTSIYAFYVRHRVHVRVHIHIFMYMYIYIYIFFFYFVQTWPLFRTLNDLRTVKRVIM